MLLVRTSESEPPGPPSQGAPDLTVYGVLVATNPSGTSPGGSFRLSAGVRNDGDAASAATTLRYYRSTDATITTADTSVGTDAVGGLAVAATSSESIDLTAPAAAGTYYYGACVEAVAGESDATNNCSASVQVSVTEVRAETHPDLAVGSPSVSDSSPTSGATFSLSAAVRNDGDGAAAATTLHYYRSTDATITTADTSVGTDAVGGLAAAATSSESIDLTAPSAPGTYYYGACVDAVTGESDTTNNCSTSVQVTVSEAATGPDLDPYAIVVTTNPGGTRPGGNVGPSVGVRNDGDESSAATTVRFYQSTDATITTADTEVGTNALGALSPGATASIGATVSAPATPGTYYYGACVDAVAGESDTTNNCSGSVPVTVSGSPAPPPPPQTNPDLEVQSPSVNDSSLDTGASFTLSATVRNDGDGAAAATTLRYYRSTDAAITSADTSVGTDAVGGLSAGATSPESISLTAPSSAGTSYYGACVDAVTGESDTTNNCSSAVSVTVSPPPPPPPPTGPDLGISGLVAVSGLDGITPPGWPLSLSAEVRNDGDAASAATTVRFYQSTDATITTSDTSVGTVAVGALAAGATSSSPRLDFNAPSSAGTYYYGACVDAVTGESDTTNNCSRSSVQVTVSEAATGPDLDPYAIVVTTNPGGTRPGGNVGPSVGVRNDGDESSAATTVRFYQSTDATITTADTEVGTNALGALSPGATASIGATVSAPATPGTYYYGACVDAVAGESDTTNNCSGSVPVTVSGSPVQTSPDLTVGSPSVNDNSPTTEGAFTLSATVRNDGDGAAAATTLRYYRSTDATITSADTSAGTDGVGGLSAGATSPESISLTAPSSAGTYYYGACVDEVTDESDATNNCSSAVAVIVSAAPPQTNPDLEVQSPSVNDSSLDTGASFTLSATVQNDGDGAAAATTLRYYRSTDATITTSDTEEGTDSVGGLSAGATSSESISLTAPSMAGTYYYGACVDTVTDESDTTNNCSGSVSVTVVVQETQPDLTVTLSITPPSGGIFHVGSSFRFGATVQNDGDGASTATTLRYYQSKDAPIRTPDTEIGTDAVGALAAPGVSAESISLTAPSAAGTYYYNACVDAVAGESNTTNNCSFVSIAVTVVPEADLVVGSPSVTDSSPETGDSFTLSATVGNDGDGAAAATTLRYYRSTDGTITTSDTEEGTDAMRGCPPGRRAPSRSA